MEKVQEKTTMRVLLEGPDGSGKTSFIKFLKGQTGLKIKTAQQPYGFSYPEEREKKTLADFINDRQEHFGVAQDGTLVHFKNKFGSHLHHPRNFDLFVCDRGYLSSIAYQADELGDTPYVSYLEMDPDCEKRWDLIIYFRRTFTYKEDRDFIENIKYRYDIAIEHARRSMNVIVFDDRWNNEDVYIKILEEMVKR